MAADLALRLLVRADNVHTDAGHHVTVYSSWRSWARQHGVEAIDIDEATAAIEAAVARWGGAGRKRLLPWP